MKVVFIMVIQLSSEKKNKYSFLRCPKCAGKNKGILNHIQQELVCQDCQRIFQIKDGIPIMLIEEDDFLNELKKKDL